MKRTRTVSSPDELIAKDFRMIQRLTARVFPHGKSDWIAAIKKVHKQDRDITQKYLRSKHPHLYVQGVWIFGDWDICAMRRENLALNAHYVLKHWSPPAL